MVKVTHTQNNHWARSWSQFPGSQPADDIVINPAVGCQYFPSVPLLPSHPESITALWQDTKLYCLGRVAPTSFMISVEPYLDQKLNRVHAELHCTNLNSDQLIKFSWTAVVIPWTTLIGQARSARRPTTVTSQSHAMLTKQSSTDWPSFVRILSFPEIITQYSH